jgi:hypothetical protein
VDLTHLPHTLDWPTDRWRFLLPGAPTYAGTFTARGGQPATDITATRIQRVPLFRTALPWLVFIHVAAVAELVDGSWACCVIRCAGRNTTGCQHPARWRHSPDLDEVLDHGLTQLDRRVLGLTLP